ncbi:hypothetical protein A2U01_0004407 [Trifolium medium]|uniref:Retrotransposon gag domain-containing protein n=1 Tax=Trifolium medium TaxID=97028 RepID=A0A392M8H3_9FABA|nr:hypothetical protein [Trifolium medium]
MTWFKGLEDDSIDSWEELNKAFSSHFTTRKREDARRKSREKQESAKERRKGQGRQRTENPERNYIGYTPLNTPHETILQECANAEFAEAGIRPPREIRENPRTDTTKFCRFHRSAGHDTEDCIQLKDAIEDLIRIGKLSKYTKGENNRNYKKRKYDFSRKAPKRSASPRRKRSPRRDSPPKERVEAIKGKETEDNEENRDPGKRPFVASITGWPTILAVRPAVKKNVTTQI